MIKNDDLLDKYNEIWNKIRNVDTEWGRQRCFNW